MRIGLAASRNEIIGNCMLRRPKHSTIEVVAPNEEEEEEEEGEEEEEKRRQIRIRRKIIIIIRRRRISNRSLC